MSQAGDVHVHLQTARLRLRAFTPDDLGNLVALDRDPDVMRYLDHVPPPPEAVRDEILPAILAADTPVTGFGRWAAEDPADGAFLGWFGFDRPHPPGAVGPRRPVEPGERLDTAELGYRLRRAAWGTGLATEGSRALIDHGFAAQGLTRVVAYTMAVNAASRRVMEKAGLHHIRTFHVDFADPLPGSDHGEVEYALTAEQWRAGR